MSDGRNNGVSPHMIFEQTYNADLKSISLTNIAAGEHASDKACSYLTYINDTAAKALQTGIEGKSKSLTVVKLNIFESHREKPGKTSTAKVAEKHKTNLSQ